ncbi:SGNH/GDSL hydrolase family protein [Streptomyces sp. NBC_00572]|uniref:SGNH/GDSL hydrolase family protein n=1 Tax=Streptomyces sp. NBC_00572 TaxID=2903664 RepID=UPI00224F4333|nr:SGNH/GDSL hydrolase family protein [Streptomyces sp. NBC_00572]MCX4986102.1 SGNH/GDSL hydrolase family protein [Streptomyces sp. NBC_00572]
MRFTRDDRLLFVGDSVTDTGRDRADPTSLGEGYVRMIAEALPFPATVVNKGLNGNRVYDLEARWDTDVLGLAPSVVTVLIGINDTWRRYDRGLISPVPEFEASLDRLLTLTAKTCAARLFVMTPFLLPASPEQERWHEDLAPRTEAVLRTAAAHGATVVRTDLALLGAAEVHGAAALAPDGVHPSPLGHRVLADAWLAAAGAGRGPASSERL